MGSRDTVLSTRACVLVVLLTLGCGGATVSDEVSGDNNAGSANSSGNVRPTRLGQWAGKSVIAGQEGARFSFPVPAGLQPLEDMTSFELEGDTVVFDSTSAGTVGKYENGYVAFNTIDVFSDPAGLGVDYSALPQEQQQRLRSRYERILKRRYPEAGPIQVVEVGGRTAFRLDLRIVRTDDLPLRAGRHYLLLDGSVTASLDCLWVPSESAQMAAACDAVVHGLERVE